ncbi:hypothetical protein KZ483_08760 [Paenibacillus sp. sptzw28]|uniref:hypothetical protein n=1 Tax=Paenibacillus sp. sptzw28 TaxID=715179 RepID=UPI001C6E40B2|nr:hypothetical protein [Paenibacillus sp. sptzw28]QYR22999.1 hypothetical protein KZ483_08760 [Paenibacillus sp. sptzw28]
MIQFELYGNLKVHHYTTDGTNIDASFTNQSKSMQTGSLYPPAPGTNSNYVYANKYKETKDGSDPALKTSFLTGTPSFTYDGSFDKYIVNYYYDKVADGTSYIRHVTRDGQSLSSVFPDRTDALTTNQNYTPTHSSAAGYSYAGYVKTTTGTPPTDFSNSTPGEYGLSPYNGAFKTLYLYYVYDLPGQINVRNMVRTSSTGTYTKESESTIAVTSLPNSQTVSADSSKGTIIGRSMSYTGYLDTSSSGSSVTVNLTGSQPKAYVTFFYEKAGTFSGDFDVLPGSVAYGDSFTLHPKDFQLQACTYVSHSFKIERGVTWIGPDVNGQSSDSTYTRSTYPSVIGVGTHSVYMKIKTSCGESSWIGPKTLTVSGPTNNYPPQFTIAWVRPSEPTKPVYEVTKGTVLNLVVINDPSVPTPTDPDGDSLSFDQFFFADSDPWMQSLPSKYPVVPWGMYNITMDGTGFHNITAQIRDQWGTTAQASTYINVIPDNPVPVIQCPPSVIENHPVPDSAFDATKSYSPLGRTINHNRDEWTNKLTSYTNGTNQDITVQVSLHVYDSTGLKSLNPATCSIIVKPDLPPVAKLDVPKLGIRNEPSVILNKSYSPDGDQIVAADYKYKYDANNNGFADDAWKTIIGQMDKVTINPDKVGKYLFYVKVIEEYGKSGDTSATTESALTLDIVNNAPEVSFEVEGKNPQPDLDASTTIRPDVMINWPVYITNTNEEVYNKNNLWTVSGGSLISSEGKNFGNQYTNIGFASQVMDNGYGTNRLSPWRAATSFNPSLTNTLLDQQGYPATFDDRLTKLKSNKKLFYFDQRKFVGGGKVSLTIYALDPKKISPQVSVYDPNSYYLKYQYRDGNPYVFIKTIPDTIAQFVSWELADKYLYVKTSDGTNDTITVYDAYTGAQLNQNSYGPYMGKGDSNGQGWWPIDHSNGSKILLRSDNNIYTTSSMPYSTRWLEISPDLSIKDLPKWTVPPIRKPELLSSMQEYRVSKPIFTDPKGAMYTYEGYVAQDNFYDMNIAKYNPDMTLAWRKYLTAPDRSGSTSQGQGGGGSISQYLNGIFINPFKNELTVYNYEANDSSYGVLYPVYYVLDSNTGTVKTRADTYVEDGSIYSWDPSYTKFYVDLNGNKVREKTSSVTADGYRTSWPLTGGCSSATIDVFDPSGNKIQQSAPYCGYSSQQLYGEYFGDGFVITAFPSNGPNGSTAMGYSVGTPTTSPLLRRGYTNGQFVSNLSLNDADMKFSFRMDNIDYDQDSAGFSFRMQNTRNRYAVETDGHSFNLMKYVNGQPTLLKAGSYAFESNKSYGIRIKAVGSQIDVFLNSIPILTVTDSTFAEGRFGYFSDKSFVTFSAFTYKAVQNKIEWSDSFAIWDEGTASADVAYNNILFLDPEGDPKAGSYRWSIQHTPRFINNQGLSSKNGQTYNSEQLTFDKVGDYIVTLQAKDDPNSSYRYPGMTFDGYRKSSNSFKKKVTVHRRPASKFTVTPGGDGKLIWTDSSYDPDRYESSANYSTEATGIDYKTTRGILEKKFYYITPSGVTVYEKLVTPQEKGNYEIGMAVKDEYGAWSDYLIVSLDVTTIPTPNAPPVPGFTTNYGNTFRGVPITINSTAYDAEDGGRENLPHEYYIRNITTGGGETLQSKSRTNWTKTFNSLGNFNIRQMVQDSAGVEAQFSRQVNIYNQIPNAQITVPASTDQNNPTKLTEFRPAFIWSYFDADGDVQSRYQLKIYKYGGVQFLDTDIKPGNVLSWRPSVDLPEHVNMYVVVRAYDGYDWGSWSNPKYFYIETNRPPTADFNWTPRPVYEGDTVMLTHAVDDLDKDPLSVKYIVTAPDGVNQSFSYTLYNPYPAAGPGFKATKAGTYQVELTVSDGKAPPVVVRRSIPVLPLMVGGQVRHTELWDLRRKDYNTNETGDPNTPRGYSVFWAGEKFVLSAQTTATGTATKADKVEVKLNGFNVVLAAGNVGRTDWNGEMWDASFETLADGPLTFTFTATYNNGTVKSDIVTVTIAGNVQQTVGVHRRQ